MAAVFCGDKGRQTLILSFSLHYKFTIKQNELQERKREIEKEERDRERKRGEEKEEGVVENMLINNAPYVRNEQNSRI